MSYNHNLKHTFTTFNDKRILKIGRILRKYKIDELLGLLNIIKGEMSFVGPRPDVPGFADRLTGDDRLILDLLPGITGPASLKYHNEDEILEQAINPLIETKKIYLDKVSINLRYYYTRNFIGDLYIILCTILIRKNLRNSK
jgi:lipopolysaccharide/colanic/teichoic acid biosynthesis glycosyltransferase